MKFFPILGDTEVRAQRHSALRYVFARNTKFRHDVIRASYFRAIRNDCKDTELVICVNLFHEMLVQHFLYRSMVDLPDLRRNFLKPALDSPVRNACFQEIFGF